MMAANEEDLLRRFQAAPSGDALRELLVVHQGRIYNTCFQVLGRAEDAEDAAQDALLKVAEGARSARDADSFRGWIYRVSLRTAIDHWRRREASRNREMRSAMNRPSSPPLDARERIALFEAMDGLDDRERALLLEHYFEKVPLADLGQRRGVSAVAIWKRIDRAREKLKKTLLGAGFVVATSRVSEALESTVPAAAPATLVGETVLGKILAGGLAMGATKSSMLPAIVITMLLLVTISTGGYLIFRSQRPSKPQSSGRATAAHRVAPAPSVVPAITAPVEASNPPSAEVVAPNNGLRETLERYRAWHAEFKESATKPHDPEDPGRHLRLQYEGFKRFKEARTQIVEEPETFLKFIKDPKNEELLDNLIFNLLGKNEQQGEGGMYSYPQYYKDFPAELLDGMFELLKAGTLPLRKSILGFFGAIHDVPERYDELYEALMYDPDWTIQYSAIWARWRQRPLDIPVLEKILARYQSSTDPEIRRTAITAISYSPRPETFGWMLDQLEADRDPALTSRLATAAARMTSKMSLDIESAERLVRNLNRAFERTEGEHEQNQLLYSALYMPVKQSVRVLEAALPKAVTPRLKTAIQSTLEKAAAGSPTWNDLQNHFWRLMKD